jgi:DNA-binding response OmpR family regulator
MNVLLVEDDVSAARFLKQALQEADYIVEVASHGVLALARGKVGDFDLILLDVMLPGIDGFEVCRRLREAGIVAPVLLLTARDAVDDIVNGLDSGADDYIVKPFRVAELLARARAMLRRADATPSTTVLRVADLTLDPAAHAAMRQGKTISLSSTESALLEYLIRNKGRVLTRAKILEQVWQYDFGGNANVLDVYIGYLRRKVDRDFEPRLIHTVRGVGFRMGVVDAT